MTKRFPVLACLTLACVSSPPSARAQSLSQILVDLLASSVITPSSPSLNGVVAGNPHEGHFLPGTAQRETPFALSRALVEQLSTFPLGSSSGGFTYTTDSTGIPKRNSGNFGPSYAERANTSGRRRFAAGINFQSVRFGRYEGFDLQGGDDPLRFYLEHSDCCPGQQTNGTPGGGPSSYQYANKFPAFEGDLLQSQVSLELRTDTTVFFGTYGLTDRLDLGIAVPIIRVDLQAHVRSEILRYSTTNFPLIHTFEADRNVSVMDFRDGGTKTGLGDIALRGKYQFLRMSNGGLALGVDLRLPTGAEENFLGTNATQVKTYLIASGEYGRFAPHWNVGYTFSRGGGLDLSLPQRTIAGSAGVVAPAFEEVAKVKDEINYTVGLVFKVSPRISGSIDMIGRTLRDVQRFDVQSTNYRFRIQTATPPPPAPPAPTTEPATLSTPALSQVGKADSLSNLTLLIGAAGLKVNVTGNLLLNANVLFPLNDQGLRIKVTPVVGLDYTF